MMDLPVFVLLIIIIIMTLIIIFFLSSINIEIVDFKIENIDNVKNIMESIIKKQYDNAFRYIKLHIKVKINILHILPITIFKCKNDGISKIIEKYKIKELKEKNINKKQKRKKRIQKIETDFLKSYKIKMIKTEISLGTTNASATALIVTYINILLSIIFAYIINNVKNYTYNVMPNYSNNIYFYSNINTKIELPIYKLLMKAMNKS